MEDEDDESTLLSSLTEVSEDIDTDTLAIIKPSNFALLFSLLKLFDKLSSNAQSKLIDTLSKQFKSFSRALDEFFEGSNQSNSTTWRNALKAYIFFIEWLQEASLLFLKSKQKEIKKGRRKIKQPIGGGNDLEKKAKATKRKPAPSQMPFEEENGDKAQSSNNQAIFKSESLLKSIEKISQCNIKILFRNKIIEDDVIDRLIAVCFFTLEISVETKNLNNKDLIFKCLQLLISKFQSNSNIEIILIKLTAKIVNLIYTQEPLVSALSEFIVIAVNGDSNLSKMAVDIIHEVTRTVFEDTNMDSQGLKNVGRFLVILSEKSSKTIYNNITSLITLYDSESYVIRNSLVEVMSNVIINILCKSDDIADVNTRNNYLKTKEKFIDILFDRIYDKNALCRSKVLSIFEKLCEHNTISVPNYLRLLNEASGRLKDEKCQVRKKAISLISKVITMYAAIFKCDRFLNYNEINNIRMQSEANIKDKESRIKEIEEGNANMGNMGSNSNTGKENEEEKTRLNEEINKENMLIEYFINYKVVLKAIDEVVPFISQLLGSKNFTDVQESIELFIVLHRLRIESSLHGVRKMLSLIMKPEPSIKKKVIDAYCEIYFSKEKSKEIQADYLIHFTSTLNFGELACLRELLKNLISSSLIDLGIFKEIWKILIKNPESELPRIKASSSEELQMKLRQIEAESHAALQILNIAGDYEPSILLNNSDLYIKNILSNLNKKKIDWLIVKDSLIGLQKIYPLHKDITELCLLKIAKTVLKHYGKEDNRWFIVTKEMIDTIFQVVTNPEKITQYFIIKLSKPFFVTEENKDVTEHKFMTQNILSQQMDLEKEPNINNSDKEEDVTPLKLAQLIFVIGQVALNMVIYSEKLETNLKKKKADKEPLNKSGIKDDINEIAGGKEAEIEFNVSLLHKLIDEDILNKNLISKFTPMIVSIAQESLTCSYEDLSKNLLLYKSAILALCKLMCINQKFCEANIPFMFELLSSDTIEDSLKLNVCSAFGDFINRFPNIMQKAISKFFQCLHSKSKEVQRYSMIVISHLVLNDMLKLKGEVVDICMLLNSEDDKLKNMVNLFFHEINQKGTNVIYNIIPKALAKLSSDYKDISYIKFQSIVKTLMKYVEKDKHTEGLIEKLFTKLKNSAEVIEWRNVTYCLSLLNYNERNINKMIEAYSNLKDKADDDEVVKENFQIIFGKWRKVPNQSQVLKDQIDLVEKKILSGEKIVLGTKDKDKASVVKQARRRGGAGKRRYKEIEESLKEEDEKDSDGENGDKDDVSSVKEEQRRSKRQLRNREVKEEQEEKRNKSKGKKKKVIDNKKKKSNIKGRGKGAKGRGRSQSKGRESSEEDEEESVDESNEDEVEDSDAE